MGRLVVVIVQFDDTQYQSRYLDIVPLVMGASVALISSGGSCSVAAGGHSHPILLQLNYEILNITHESNM
jgi:hypothetical protein